MIWKLVKWFQPDDWKRGVALVILWAYFYQLVIWPVMVFGLRLTTWWFTFDPPLPEPVIVPWEQLATGTMTLAAIGGIETWREQVRKGDVE